MLHVTHAPGKALWGDMLGRGTPKVWPSYRSHTSTCAHQLRPGSLDMASVGLLWPVGGRGVCVHTHAHVCTGESALISLSSSSSQVLVGLSAQIPYLSGILGPGHGGRRQAGPAWGRRGMQGKPAPQCVSTMFYPQCLHLLVPACLHGAPAILRKSGLDAARCQK